MTDPQPDFRGAFTTGGAAVIPDMRVPIDLLEWARTIFEQVPWSPQTAEWRKSLNDWQDVYRKTLGGGEGRTVPVDVDRFDGPQHARQPRSPWRVESYPNGDGERNWTEYSVVSDDGPICTGVLTESIAKQIANAPWFRKRYEELIEDMFRRSDRDPSISTANTLIEVLAELKRLNARPSDSRSSANVKDSARGYDLDVKSYADGLLIDALDDAIREYARGKRELEALKLNGWQDTLDAKREAAG